MLSIRRKITISFLLTIGLMSFSCNSTNTGICTDNCLIESGIASWYGYEYPARCTANGETYNREALTAAHKTLPFNTIVRVENIVNGKSVVVRINDRGPYVPGRVIDLSQNAAREIEILEQGLADVELYLIKESGSPELDFLQGCEEL